jgi:hypothetical protein
MMNVYGFKRAADRALPDVVVDAAEKIITCVVFLNNGKPFYYGNHVAAASAAQSLEDTQLKSLRSNTDQKVQLALPIIDTYRDFQKTGDRTSVNTLYVFAQRLQQAGGLQNWQAHKLASPWLAV